MGRSFKTGPSTLCNRLLGKSLEVLPGISLPGFTCVKHITCVRSPAGILSKIFFTLRHVKMQTLKEKEKLKTE